MPILTRADGKTWVVAVVVVGAAGLLYFLTAARDIVVGDTPELTTAAVTLGVPHPPGYPLFTMLGHLFSLLPFGPVPFRVNLLAVTCPLIPSLVCTIPCPTSLPLRALAYWSSRHRPMVPE
jgi:hypothetical protein